MLTTPNVCVRGLTWIHSRRIGGYASQCYDPVRPNKENDASLDFHGPKVLSFMSSPVSGAIVIIIVDLSTIRFTKSRSGPTLASSCPLHCCPSFLQFALTCKQGGSRRVS